MLRDTNSKGHVHEYTFDAPAILADRPWPSLVYVAFYSDVEHEVLPVRSGHRVTITYNLYYTRNDVPDGQVEGVVAPTPIFETETALVRSLQRAFESRWFLPEGGNIVFYLHHKYPITEDQYTKDPQAQLQNVASCLKGVDAAAWRAVRALGLEPVLRLLYDDSEYSTIPVMLDHNVTFRDDGLVEGKLNDYLVAREQGIALIPGTILPMYPYSWGLYERVPALFVNYKYNREGRQRETKFMAYGNEASLATAYWYVGMFVCVGAFGSREITANIMPQPVCATSPEPVSPIYEM